MVIAVLSMVGSSNENYITISMVVSSIGCKQI